MATRINGGSNHGSSNSRVQLSHAQGNGYGYMGGSSSSSGPTIRRSAPVQRESAGDLGNSSVVRATEGWIELFLTPPEKFAFSKWREVVRDRSLVHQTTQPYFQFLAAKYLPDNLAPNVLTLAGFLSLGQAWYATNNYGAEYPVHCTVLCMMNIFIFWVTTSLTGYHADRIRQNTALSDLFKYSCDSGSTVWLAMLTVYCLGGTTAETQWYAVQASQLVLLLKHLSAFQRHAGLRYSPTAGPGEVLMTCMLLLAARAVLGLDGLQNLLSVCIFQPLGRLVRWQEESTTRPPYLFTPISGDEVVRFTYYALFVATIVKSVLLPAPHGWTRFGLTGSLLMRFVPALLLQWVPSAYAVTVMDVVCDGFFLTVLTSDMILAKMADRELHPVVVLMSLAAVLSHSVILTLVAVYYIAVFCDLCFYLNLPLLATCRNVYCDGVYDLCHIGHKRAFQNALALGNRLLVGVVGDEDASQYKRPPIMTHAERCAEVEACKAVTKVIPNAPCFGLTPEFLEEHQIHVVAFGEEYLDKYPNPDDDPYYSYARKIGIAHPLPRTNTLSTTDLIKRIQLAALNAPDGDLTKKNSPT